MFHGRPVLPSKDDTSVSTAALTAGLLLFIVATRWPLAPKYLYYFDSANFALALEKFNPAMHQPQPPGYPLFVALTRLIHFWVDRPERVFLIAGILAACAATLLIRLLATELFGRTAGIFAAVGLASNPVFWFGGITNQIRVFLALIAITIALLAWRALQYPERPVWFYSAFAALGIAAGFRPVCASLLLPLLLWVWFRGSRSVGRLALGLSILIATALPWLAVLVLVVGGPSRLLEIMWGYATVQFQGTSALFGADTNSAEKMFKAALVWNLLGPLAWIWAVPFLRRQPLGSDWRDKVAFLSVAFFPTFLFSAFVHIGDPDQALASVAILCVFGGAVLATLSEQVGGRRVFTFGIVLVAVHVLVFFCPPGKLAKASSFKAVAAVDRMNTAAIQSIESLRRTGPLTIVHWGSSVASRHLSYYFPEDYVVVLPGSPAQPGMGGTPELYYRHESLPQPPGTSIPLRSGTKRVVCLLPYNAKPGDLPGWKPFGSVYYLDLPDFAPVPLGQHTLVRWFL